MDSDDDSITAAVRDQYDTSPEDETIVVEPTSELESPENEKRGPGRPFSFLREMPTRVSSRWMVA
jgi:hypothetical protein